MYEYFDLHVDLSVLTATFHVFLKVQPLNPFIHSFIHSDNFYSASSSPLLFSEALPTQHGYCAGVSRLSATGSCELRTCPRSLRGCYSGSRNHDPSVESYQLSQCATTSHVRFPVKKTHRQGTVTPLILPSAYSRIPPLSP